MKKFLSKSDKSSNRRKDRQSTKLDTFYSIIDRNFICNLGFVDNSNSLFILPMLYARYRNSILIHGSTGSRLMLALEKKIDVTISIFELNGLVMAKSAFESSANYSSVVIFGKSEKIESNLKEKYLNHLTNHIFPERTKEIRKSTKKEISATSIIKISIKEASIKLRSGPPKESKLDQELKIWSGVIPFKIVANKPIPSDELSKSLNYPKSVNKILKIYS